MSLICNASSTKLVALSAVLANPPCTFSAWVRPDVTNAQLCAIGLGNTSSNNPFIRLLMRNTGVAAIEFRNEGLSSSNGVGTTVLSTSAFTHILGTVDSSFVSKIYVAGTLEGTGSAANGPIGGGAALDNTTIAVSKRATEGSFWDGFLAECGLWNIEADSTMRANLAAGYAVSCFTTGLVAYQNLRSAANEPGSGGTPTYGPAMSLTDGSFDASNPTIDDLCGAGGARQQRTMMLGFG
jgi:hypothetical protein